MAVNDIVTRLMADDRTQQALTSAAGKLRAFSAEGQKHVGALNTVLSATMGRYLAIGGAIETARRAFKDYANFESQLRKIAVSSGETLDRVEQLIPSFHKWARDSG